MVVVLIVKSLRWALSAIGSFSLLFQLTGCAGTLLEARSERAATAGDFERAKAYDAHIPDLSESERASHTKGYVERQLARLAESNGTPDAQAAEVRGLLAWARNEKEEAVVGGVIRSRLGELARARWGRVTAAANKGHVDEAVLLGRALLVDTPSDAPEHVDLRRFEAQARTAHEGSARTLAVTSGNDAAVMLHERLARLMGGAPTPAGELATAATTKRTGLSSAAEESEVGACAPAVALVRASLPTGGDTPIRFAFRFEKCRETVAASQSRAYRDVPVEQEVLRIVSDTVRESVCRDVQGSCSSLPNCMPGRNCIDCNHATVCTNEWKAIDHTERVRLTRFVPTPYVVHHLRHDIAYAAVLTAEVQGEHHEVRIELTAHSSELRNDDTPPASATAERQAQGDVAIGLAEGARKLIALAREKQVEHLRAQARSATAAGDLGRSEALYVESSLIAGAVDPELLVSGVPRVAIETVLFDKALTQLDVVPSAPRLPTISESEILEDAHERTDRTTLSATARAGYLGALVGGASRWEAPTAGDSATGGLVGVYCIGAEKLGTPVTAVGGSFHMFGNFDGGTSSFDMSMDIGAGLKLGSFFLLPVGGVAVGTSTHASPSESGFRPNAALRATAVDAVYGGQVSFALPYPVNLTLHAQLVRTAPVPLDDFKQFTTRLQGSISYGLSTGLQFVVFARYWELATDSVEPLRFFGGNGHDHRLFTVGLGIAAANETGFISSLFGAAKN